jgi:hypothetical protein
VRFRCETGYAALKYSAIASAACRWKALLRHVRKFCTDCIDTSKHQPFYRPSPSPMV